jgi:hypothetical protein
LFTHSRLATVVAALVFSVPIGVLADTLVMRDGTRVRGELIAVRNSTIEFQEQRGYGSGRTIRVDRNEVARIEFDDVGNGNYSGGFGTGGSTRGMRERQVSVFANTQWNDTGIDVRAGQSIYVEGSGEVSWGPSRRDGPEGEHNSPSNPNRPMPNRPGGALIGKVGESNDIFFIGADTGAIRVRNGGRLYLGVNDDVLTDNRGSFRVVVRY